MPDVQAESPPQSADAAKKAAIDAKLARKIRRRKWARRLLGTLLLVLIVGGIIGRAFLGPFLTKYVNRVIDQNKLYDGKIGGITIDLWKGQYSIDKIKLLKRTGNTTAPLFECQRLDLAVEWSALLHGRVKGRVYAERPNINLVDEPLEGDSQTGASLGAGPWLGIIRSLFPFDINSAELHQGSLHFLAPSREPPVDVYLDRLDVLVKDLSNIKGTRRQLNSSVDITGRAMDSGDLECHVKFDPFSYKPTFELALKLVALDVTKTNAFTRAYGKFDFERGWFDLIVQLNCHEGLLDGFTRPLFRDVQIFGPPDLKEGLVNAFWQALVGAGEVVLRNQPRDQFGTQIPIVGVLDAPKPDVLATVFNVLRNAFVRAYLPRLEGDTPDVSGLEFKPGDITGAPAPADPQTAGKD